jgi:hypothetical protein
MLSRACGAPASSRCACAAAALRRSGRSKRHRRPARPASSSRPSVAIGCVADCVRRFSISRSRWCSAPTSASLPLRVVEQVVLEVRVALDHPDVAQHLVQHAGRATGATLAAQLVSSVPRGARAAGSRSRGRRTTCSCRGFRAGAGRLRQVPGRPVAALRRAGAPAGGGGELPNLKADANFRDLQAQVEGTENRIAVARNRYIKAVQEYNVTVRVFPNNLTAMLFGYKTKANFTVEDEKAISAPPAIKFDAAAKPAQPRRRRAARAAQAGLLTACCAWPADRWRCSACCSCRRVAADALVPCRRSRRASPTSPDTLSRDQARPLEAELAQFDRSAAARSPSCWCRPRSPRPSSLFASASPTPGSSAARASTTAS